jgi:CSLREA domain-containing protein
VKDSSATPTLRRRSPWGSAPLILAALGLMAAPASAATVVVNTTADLNTGSCSSTCSLRDAVATANPGDTVQVPGGHYVLSLGDIVSAHNLTIAGAGARLTVLDGNGASRIFQFNGRPFVVGPPFEVDDVALVNGLAATNSAATSGPDGGAVVGAGTLVLRRCLVANSQARTGGGIWWFGGLTVDQSTIAGNRATGSVEGFAGGGIFGALGPDPITNSTITGNTAPAGTIGGGVALEETEVSFVNDTITGNQAGIGGGIGYLAMGTLADTIIAGNTGGDCSRFFFVLTPDHSLDSDNSCHLTDAGSLPGVDPLLGPLANNGGPTDTQALLAGSPAIDAGNNATCLPTDQRGVTRPQGPACDIGAYEVLTPQGQIAALIAQINALVTAGSLAPNNANPLITKLNQVVNKLNGAQTTAACGQLGAFLNQLNADIGNGTLTPTEGQPLLDAANAIQASIGC